MKNKYVLASSLLLSNYVAKSQNQTESQQPTEDPEFKTTEVELLYNQYIQDGNNSAITGGIGTEELLVFGPSIAIKSNFGLNGISFQLGTDIISSASTDNIDSVVSSVSKLDARTYTNLGYERTLEKNKITLNAGISFSIESDYFSFGKFLGATKVSKDNMQSYALNIQIFNDDLRWGRLNSSTNYGPAFLIYPEELRFQEWYDVEKRNTYTADFAFSQVVNPRHVFGASALFSYQEGLLETPFHRIYFNDGSLGVEQLPPERYKGTLAFRLNSFIRGNVITKNSVSGYSDNFGITGFAVENETALKVDPKWTIYGNVRFYTQSAADYFAPYGEHDPSEYYYTSDYDLSKFNSIRIGVGVKLSPYSFSKTKPNKRFDSATLKYNYYRRSNDLYAHMCSLSIYTTKFKARKKRR